MDGAVWSTLSGGLGLFLLGMGMMTDGLKLAAGQALHRILERATRTRLQALASGVLVTALVQSSSAVTVAAIGFVNAGLLALAPSLWVLFGSNVGTSMTGWIVALVGLKFKVEALALPLVGLGALLRLAGEGRRVAALGTALAGFGLLFTGIALLQQAFVGLSAQISLPAGEGVWAVLAQLGIGVVMTVLMQSSSAAMAVTLTAAQGGLIGAQGAAAVVIGANIGTTVTALLATIGATPNARRAAAAHVVFNLLTGVVALLLLPWMIHVLGWLREVLSLPPDPATNLALFHTSFNVLGVLLMWPLAGQLAHRLQQLFRAREEDEAHPRFLDDTVLGVPALALDALQRELARLGAVAVASVQLGAEGAAGLAVQSRYVIFSSLTASIERFVERLRSASMTHEASARLARLLQARRYYTDAIEQAQDLARMDGPFLRDVPLAGTVQAFVSAVEAELRHAEPTTVSVPLELVGISPELEQAYDQLREALLAEGTEGRMALADMDRVLRRASALRRATQQLTKARKCLYETG